MSNNPVIAALNDKKKDILSQIKTHKRLISNLQNNIKTIDDAISLFDPNFAVSGKSRSVYTKHFEIGEAKRLILNAMRENSDPIGSDDIAKITALKKNFVSDDKNQLRSFQKSVANSLSSMEKKGLIQRVGKDGLNIIWKIKEIN